MIDEAKSRFVGLFKNPLQKPEVYRPTMYMLSDGNKTEMDLIILTPGALLHAYKYINEFNPQQVRIFTPSLRYEFISDIFNLYMYEKELRPTKWVFPDSVNHYDFENGQIKISNYVNEVDFDLTISYLENENVDDVYDIMVRDGNSCSYFCHYLTEELATLLYENNDIDHVYLPYQSTLYGGLSYKDIVDTLDSTKSGKFIPHSFISIDEFELYLKSQNLAKGEVIYNDFV